MKALWLDRSYYINVVHLPVKKIERVTDISQFRSAGVDLLWSSSHIRVRRFRCGDSQSDYYAHDVQHSDAWKWGDEGGGGGEKGKRGDRMGWGEGGWEKDSQGPTYSNGPLQKGGAVEPQPTAHGHGGPEDGGHKHLLKISKYKMASGSCCMWLCQQSAVFSTASYTFQTLFLWIKCFYSSCRLWCWSNPDFLLSLFYLSQRRSVCCCGYLFFMWNRHPSHGTTLKGMWMY